MALVNFRLKWLVVAGAATLMIGVFVFCHAELRNAEWITVAQSSSGFSDEGDQWFLIMNSIGHEEWLALALLLPIGVGSLAGSLLTLAVRTRCRFEVRTLLIAISYFAVIVGIPFGLVRPRLQNPRFWLRLENPDIAFGQRRQWTEPDGTRPTGDPWVNKPGASYSGRSISFITLKTLLVGCGAFIVTPLIAFIPITRQRSPSQIGES